MMRSLAVFCGSKTGKHPIYQDIANQLGKTMVSKNITLVYGGGDVGLMGITAQTVIEAGGRVIGVMPKFLQEREGHFKATEYTIVETMHQRKAVMADRADAFLILPGGYGTMDEFMEIVTWRQLGLHDKPIGVLNVNGYYNHLWRI
ncbi:MAG: TIGR00730 family Rossman fold protein [Saprospiraceae bacterium]|nr:TIGR00730 family Rossman fold protein [Saprospiraceae bacterium]